MLECDYSHTLGLVKINYDFLKRIDYASTTSLCIQFYSY